MTTLAHTALERYGLRGAGLQQLRQGFVRVFHVVGSDREEFCLRMYDLPADSEHASRPAPPPGRPSLDQLRAQLMWLSALARETSLLVPELVPAVDGSLMAYVFPEGEVQPHERGRQCVLQRWVPGTHKRVLLAADGSIDLVLLDIMLPQLDGHRVLERIRLRRPDLPILMLTARDDLKNKVSALDAGADDYLTKPFDLEELLARIRATTRRADQPRASRIEAGDLKVDLRSRRVWRGERTVDLSSREFALLEYFMSHPGQVLSRQQILSAIWDFAFDPGSNVVDIYVSYLRNKIDRPGEPFLIQTVRGAGYRFEPSTGVPT